MGLYQNRRYKFINDKRVKCRGEEIFSKRVLGMDYKVRINSKYDYKIFEFKCLKFERCINQQCISFGFTISWNWRPSVEIDFLFWRLAVEWRKRRLIEVKS